MKKSGLTVIILLSLILSTSAQTGSSGDEDVRLYIDGTSQLSVANFTNPGIPTKGDVYLFSDWVNGAKLYTKNKQRYIISGLNYNIKKEVFEIKRSKDSIFTLDSNSIDHLNINGSIYKTEKVADDETFFEILLKKEELSFLKKNTIRLIVGKMNPLNGIQEPNTYYKSYDYYLIQDGESKKIKLKKKDLNSVFDTQSNIMKQYVKENSLSYKDEKDVIKIFAHYSTL